MPKKYKVVVVSNNVIIANRKKSKAECMAFIYERHKNQSMTIIVTEWPESQLNREHMAVVVQFNKYNQSDVHYHIFEIGKL